MPSLKVVFTVKVFLGGERKMNVFPNKSMIVFSVISEMCEGCLLGFKS